MTKRFILNAGEASDKAFKILIHVRTYRQVRKTVIKSAGQYRRRIRQLRVASVQLLTLNSTGLLDLYW